jgi:hypothetical protein
VPTTAAYPLNVTTLPASKNSKMQLNTTMSGILVQMSLETELNTTLSATGKSAQVGEKKHCIDERKARWDHSVRRYITIDCAGVDGWSRGRTGIRAVVWASRDPPRGRHG